MAWHHQAAPGRSEAAEVSSQRDGKSTVSSSPTAPRQQGGLGGACSGRLPLALAERASHLSLVVCTRTCVLNTYGSLRIFLSLDFLMQILNKKSQLPSQPPRGVGFTERAQETFSHLMEAAE